MNQRTAIAEREDAQIQSNVAKIEEQKARPTAIQAMARRLNISPAGLQQTLLDTVFKGAKESEFAALIVVANEYGLNPLTKEIYAFPAKGGGIVPVVSIDGWIRIANQHPMYNGDEQNFIYDDNKKLFAVETVIYRKDRDHPTKKTEFLSECKRATDPWKMEHRMLGHKSYIQAVRYAFGFSGIYDADDAELIIDHEPQPGPVPTSRQLQQRQAEQKPQNDAPAETRSEEDIARELDSKFDPHTGEIIDESPDPSNASPPSDASADQDEPSGQHSGGQQEAPDNPDPRRAKVDEWLAGLVDADAGRIKVVEKEFLNHAAAMPEEMVQEMESAIKAARGAL